MTAEVNGVETSRGRWSDAQFSFGEMLARASADARLRPGDLIGSGTVGSGCLLEVRDATLGRYLEPGDEVTLRIERLGALRNPIVARPDEPGPLAAERVRGIEPMRPTTGPTVRRIYATGIATGNATLERDGPRLGALRPLAPARLPARRSRSRHGIVVGWMALSRLLVAQGLRGRRLGERLCRRRRPAAGESAAPFSRR